ncbi:MAG: hypothetical protein MK193_00210 [Lentisphaeria bacterium]|nr:hypothetical protein [Lentisphaeria bacterium]
MAKSEKESKEPENKKKSHPFLFGIILGIIGGYLLGMMYPLSEDQQESIHAIKSKTESAIEESSIEARNKLANVLEVSSEKIRVEEENQQEE